MRTCDLLALALLATATLSGCGSETPEKVVEPAGEIGPDAPPGIALSDARVQLPVVTGRPGVAYFTVSQNGGAARSIAAVSVAGAGRSEMHETREVAGVSRMVAVEQVPLGSGGTVRFAPGGYHVMLHDLGGELAPGGSTELTVTFDNGDKASITAPVTAPGDARMAEHDH